jgi:hypothetical protein
MRGLNRWVFSVGIWMSLWIGVLWTAGLSQSVQAMPQSKLHYEAIDTLFSPQYFVFLGAYLPKDSNGRVSVDYEKSSSEVHFFYKINNQEHLNISSKKSTYLTSCNRDEIRSYFNHPHLGTLFVCTRQSSTHHNEDRSSFMSLQPRAGLYLSGQHKGPVQNLSAHLSNMSLYMTSASVIPRSFSMQQHMNLYHWLYPQEQHDLFGGIGLSLQQVEVSWSGEDYPKMSYTFSGFSPGSSPQGLSTGLYSRQRSSIHFDYYFKPYVVPCHSSEITLNFAYSPHNYALCVRPPASSVERSRPGLKKPFTRASLQASVATAPANSLSFDMPHDDLLKALQILRDRQALY